MKNLIIIPFLSLLAVLQLGCKANDEIPNRPPGIATMQASLESINPFTYTFTVNVIDPDLDPLTYTWDFGEGTVREGQENETHVFEPDGSFVVSVTVTDDGGQSDTQSVGVQTTTSEVLVDLTAEHQTIEGFGGFGTQAVPWSSGPFTSERFINDLMDLGVTIIRDEVPTNFEIENDNDDPNVINYDGFNLNEDHSGHHRPLGTRIQFFKDMIAAEPNVKFIATVWSPPPWMKANNLVDNGTDQNSAPDYQENPGSDANQLLEENYEEFAEMCVAYVNIFKQETGRDLYAFSIQNEPRFSQSYQSCLYNGAALRDLLKVVGKRFEDEGLDTKLFVPEDVGFLGGVQSLVDPIMSDPEARQYVDMLAVHGYAFDGITAGSQGAETWETMYNWGAPYDIPLWMTETSGYDNNIEDAIKLAKGMYTSLRFGNISAWVFWTISGGNNLNGFNLITSDGKKSKGWFVSKNFYRFIRPGALRTDATSEEDQVLALSFKHPTDNTATVVLVNVGSSDQVMRVAGSGLPSNWEVYRTSAQENCATLDPISSDESVLIPAQSIVTLMGAR